MVGAAAAPFHFWEPARHFKAKRNLSLQQVPHLCHKLGVYPRQVCVCVCVCGGALPEIGAGPSFISQFKRRKAKRSLSVGSRVPGKPGRAGEHSPRQGASPPEAAGPLHPWVARAGRWGQRGRISRRPWHRDTEKLLRAPRPPSVTSQRTHQGQRSQISGNGTPPPAGKITYA